MQFDSYMGAKYYTRVNIVGFGNVARLSTKLKCLTRKGNKLSFPKRHRVRMLTIAVIFHCIKWRLTNKENIYRYSSFDVVLRACTNYCHIVNDWLINSTYLPILLYRTVRNWNIYFICLCILFHWLHFKIYRPFY